MVRWQEFLEEPLTALLASMPLATEDPAESESIRKLAIGIEGLFRSEVSNQWAGWPYGSTTDGLSVDLCFRSGPDSLEVVGVTWLDFDGDTFPFRAVLTRTPTHPLSVLIYVGQVDAAGQLPRLRGAVIIAARDKRGTPTPEIIVGRLQQRIVWTKALEWHPPL